MTLDEVPPWEQLQLFQAPVETAISVTTVNVLAAKGDPMRRTLIFCPFPPAAGTVLASTKQSGGALTGINIVTNPPLVISWQEWGPLVCSPWYLSVIAPGTADVTVITHSLLRWPGDASEPTEIEKVDRAANDAANRSAEYHGFRQYIDRYCRPQSAAEEAHCIAALVQRCTGQSQWSRNGNGWIPPRSWGRPADTRYRPLRG